MKESSRPVARIGMVHYINMAPITETWKSRPHDPGWKLVEAHPAALNRMLAENEIDLGFVSSYEYGRRPEDYRLLDGLSISSNGAVGSVFLFSEVEPEALSGKAVLLSSQSKTSVCLVKIVLEKFYGATPVYISDADSTLEHPPAAVLAIGDDALRLRMGTAYTHRLDLGEVWLHHTGLPFVFGVCAVRNEFVRSHPDLVSAIHRELLHCAEQGRESLAKVCEIAAPRIPMDPGVCYTYLQGIEYNLGPKKKEALERFYTWIFDFDEALDACLPLKIMKVDE